MTEQTKEQPKEQVKLNKDGVPAGKVLTQKELAAAKAKIKARK